MFRFLFLYLSFRALRFLVLSKLEGNCHPTLSGPASCPSQYEPALFGKFTRNFRVAISSQMAALLDLKPSEGQIEQRCDNESHLESYVTSRLSDRSGEPNLAHPRNDKTH